MYNYIEVRFVVSITLIVSNCKFHGMYTFIMITISNGYLKLWFSRTFNARCIYARTNILRHLFYDLR